MKNKFKIIKMDSEQSADVNGKLLWGVKGIALSIWREKELYCLYCSKYLCEDNFEEVYVTGDVYVDDYHYQEEHPEIWAFLSLM